MLCGLSWNVNSMIFFRILQGLGGRRAAADRHWGRFTRVFPAEERGRAGGGYRHPSVAGACAYDLGGYIIQYFDWRLIFYLNVPIGIVGLFMCAVLLKRGRFNEHARLGISCGLTPATLAFRRRSAGLARPLAWLALGYRVSSAVLPDSTACAIVVELRSAGSAIGFQPIQELELDRALLITVATTFALFGALAIRN